VATGSQQKEFEGIAGLFKGADKNKWSVGIEKILPLLEDKLFLRI
jgi:hypothetical protein